MTYEECKVVRKKTNLPFILDECMDSIQSALRAWSENSVDIINLKISRLGGLSKSKLFKDICSSLGISLTIEDLKSNHGCGNCTFTHTTPTDLHFQSSAFHEYTNIETAIGAPTIESGYMYCSNKPGLGIIPNYDVLGNPVMHLFDRV